MRDLTARAGMDDLVLQLDDRPIAVRTTTYRRSNRRVAFDLDDDTTVTLRLFWPRRAAIGALLSARLDDRIGWIVVGRPPQGEPVIFYAWLATRSSNAPRRSDRSLV